MATFVFSGIIVQEDDGYSALCPELDVASQGDIIDEAKVQLLEAVTLHLEGSIEDGLLYRRAIPSDADPRQSVPSEVVTVFQFKVDVAVYAHA